jgi:type VI secretion system protein ImpK
MSDVKTDYDSTVVELGGDENRQNDNLKFAAVAVAPSGTQQRNVSYVAQQASTEEFTSGVNPLVNAAAPLLLEIVKIKRGMVEDIEALRSRLEAEVNSFTNHAQTLGIRESEWNAARYLLCTALDECVTSSQIPGAAANWSSKSLLTTFHKETQGGEIFFQVLDRTLQQPAANLYLLELIYLLLSLGFEGKYKLQDKGTLTLESQRDSLFRQIRLLRGDSSLDLAKKIERPTAKNKIYVHVPMWLLGAVVAFCLAVTFWGFSFTLSQKAESLLALYLAHAPKSKPYTEPAASKPQPEDAAAASETPDQTHATTTTETK